MILHYIFLALLSSAVVFELCVFAQNNCELPIPENTLSQDVDNQLPSEPDPNIMVQVVNTSYNCLTHAENPTFHLYAGVSIEYTKTEEPPAYFRAVYRCSGSTWVNTDFNSSMTTLGTEPFLSNAYRRENCSTCSLTASDDYLCVPCNGSCLESSNSLQYCYGPDSSECCNFILSGTCNISCPVNFEANSSSVCVCQNQWAGELCDQCPIACVNGTRNSNCTSCDCIAGFEGDLCDADINECDLIPCANNGTCNNLVNNFTCDCANSWIGRVCEVCPLECGNGTQSPNCSVCTCDPGYTGERCETDIDDCVTSPCANGGNCSDRVNNFTCSCVPFWDGRTCETCSLGCVNGTQSVDCSECLCEAGFSGQLCEVDINECQPNPCLNNGTCLDRVNNFTCSCVPFWDGRTCETCSLGCVNGTQSVDCSECLCEAGFSGQLCDVDINECQPNPCLNNGTCLDRVNNFTCSCVPFWDGWTCETCSLGCVNGTQSVDCSECLCEAGFSGQLCDVDINECQPNPCLNNGTCLDRVNNFTCSCVPFWDGWTCETCSLGCVNGTQSVDCSECLCEAGFSGQLCDVDINECQPNPCLNNGTCLDRVNNFTCSCVPFWDGRTCETCSLGCVNGNQSVDCSECLCEGGFSGQLCDVDINECQPNPCLNNGTCLDRVNNFTCSCVPFWDGRTCETCSLGCVNGTQSVDCSECLCEAGFSGQLCDVDINECQPNPCLNNGTCLDRVNNFTCSCVPFWDGWTCETCSLGCVNGTQSVDCSECLCEAGFSGQLCDLDINECQPNPCLNNGSCLDRVNNFTCSCVPFWDGRTCETCSLGCVNGTQSVDCSECLCEAGFSGQLCDVDINECQPNPCLNNGTCLDRVNNFTCVCVPFWDGRTCETCSLACGNGTYSADCSSCSCNPGYRGDMCEIDIDECSPDPCLNNGTCLDRVNNYTCTCTNEWVGRNCSDCLLECNNGVSSDSCSMCVCESQYTGDSCDAILDPCESNPCRHEGECVANSTVYECLCLSGYIGEDCGVGVYTCNNSDTCNLGACVEAAAPEEIEGAPPSYCVCPPSYTGEVCDEVISGCVPGACQNGGRCDIGKNEFYNLSFTCACRDPFSGPNCQLCSLDGLCDNGIRSADCSRCICDLPYKGTFCRESSCPEGQVVDGNQCKETCSTNSYQPSAGNKYICSACGIDKCVQCDKGGGVCTECQVGYEVDKKECVRILLGCGIENCERCYVGICTVCVANYSLTYDNGCKKIFKKGDTSANTNNHLQIIILSVTGVALLCIILVVVLIGTGVAVVYYKKAEKESGSEQTDKKEEIEFSNPIYLGAQADSKLDLIQSI